MDQSRNDGGEPVMENGISYAGLDVHKSEIVVALYKADEETPREWRVGTDARSVKRLAQRLLEESAGRVECVYEAGPTGFVLQRQLTGLGDARKLVATCALGI